MRSSFQYPFRIFANQNFGTQFDYTHFTGEWLNSKGTGQSPVLPEVNVATGNVILKSTFVQTQEQMGQFEFGFVYNAQNKMPWSYNISHILDPDDKKLILRERDGSEVTYFWDSEQSAYLAPSGGHSKSFIKKQQDNSWVQYDPKTGMRMCFDCLGNMTAVYDSRGCWMKYDYDRDGNLQHILSPAGTYSILHMDSEVQCVFTKTGETKNQILGIWKFGTQQRLQNATIPGTQNYVIDYHYNDNTNQLISIHQTDGTAIHFTYTTDNSAKIKTLQQGSVGPRYTVDYADHRTTITDAAGSSIAATLNDAGCIVALEQCVNDCVLKTTCSYENGDIKSVTQCDGSTKNWVLNSQGLILRAVGRNHQITEYDYDDFDPETFACILKRELVFVDDQKKEHWAVTRFVYKHDVRKQGQFAFRDLAFKISPLGCVTEYRYNSQGLLESERTYLKNRYDLSGFSEKHALQYEELEKWVAVQPLDAISLKTFSENERGQITESRIFAEIDSNGNGKDTPDASHRVYANHALWGGIETQTEKMDVDKQGNEITATTQQSFDLLKRLVSHQNAQQEIRTIDFHDDQQYGVTTEPNDRTETQAWNDAGQMTTVTTNIKNSTVSRIKSNQYDPAGRVSAIKNIDGQTTYQLFDSLNRLRFVITPAGRVTEYFYDDVNCYRSIRHYDCFVSTQSFSVQPPTLDWLKQNLKIDAEKDVVTYQIFDASKRLCFEIDGRGAVIEHRYDLRNHETATITYADKITADELVSLQRNQFSRIPDVKKDRVHMTFYDVEGHVIATQDPMGYVVRHNRNPAGFETYRYYYANPEKIDLSNTVFPEPSKSSDDFGKFLYCNAKGQVIATVEDVANAYYIKKQAYYPTGKLKEEIKYANPANVQPNLTSDPKTLTPAADSEDQRTFCEYDLLERLLKEHLPEQRLHARQFDNMGNQTIDRIGDDSDQLPPDAIITTQTTAKRFDDWGQCIAEASPLVYEKIAAIQNDVTLTSDQKNQQINAIWEKQALRNLYDEATGLHIGKIDITPDDADSNKLAKTLFYCDLDHRIVLTIGPEGQVSSTTWHPIFDKAIEQYRYATAINTDQLSSLNGGFENNFNRALLTLDPADISDQYEYDQGGSENKHIDPDGFVTETHTNMFGQWYAQKRSIHSTTPTLSVARVFNLRAQLEKETHNVNDKSIITVDKEYKNLHGLCTASRDGNSAENKFSYEPRGVLATSTDPLNRATTFSHDAFEREEEHVLPTKIKIQHVYTQAKRKINKKYIHTSGKILAETTATSDALGQVIEHQDAEGHIDKTTYNLAHQWTTKSNALHTQTRKFDLRALPKRKNFENSASSYHMISAQEYTSSRELSSETQDVGCLNLNSTHSNNPLGQCDQTITPSKKIRRTKFNKRSLATERHAVLDATAALNPTPGQVVPAVITSQTYNGQGNSDCVTHATNTLPESYVEKEMHDDFGRDAGHIIDPDNLKLTNQQILDNASYLVKQIDPKGQATYFIRDAAHNVRFEINAKGGVTEHRYNAANKPIFTVQYVTAIDLSKINENTNEDAISAFMTSNSYDRHTYYFYDGLDNERFRINRSGAITEMRYNKNSEKIANIQYYNTIPDDPNTLTTELLETRCKQICRIDSDKATFHVLDELGQERFLIDAEGCVTQKFYYSVPHQVNHEIKYATKISDPESFSKLSLEKINQQLILNTTLDRKTYWMVDGLGRLQFYVTPKGAVTRYDYDGDTKNRTKMTEFKNTVNTNLAYSDLVTLLNNLVPDPKVDNIETRQYDEAEREITRINGLGKSESFGYDGASRKSSHTTLSQHKWNYGYDTANRLWRECSPTTDVYTASIDPNHVTEVVVTKQNTSVKKQTDYDLNSNAINIASGVDLSDEHIVKFAYNELNKIEKSIWSNLRVDDPSKNTDLLIRPDTAQDVSQRTVYGAHGEKCVVMNEVLQPEFYVYNSAGFLNYRVNAQGYVVEYQRNAFGQCEKLIAYATRLTLDLKKYTEANLKTESLLTSDIVSTHLQSDSTRDHSYSRRFDRLNHVVEIKRDPVITYIPDKNPSNPAVISTTEPTTQKIYNAFGEMRVESILIDEKNNLWRKQFTWHDQDGHPIATVDANGYVNTFKLDERGRQIEEYRYAIPISLDQLTEDTTNQQLQALLTKDPAHDHHILTPRDVIGRIQGIYHVGLVTQKIVSGQQVFVSNPAATSCDRIGVTYTYTDDNKIQTITYPNGGVEVWYYDERRYLIAKAAVPRTQTDFELGTTKKIRPITYYHISAHGDCVETYIPDGGCAVDIDPTVLPEPISQPDKDRYHRWMRDSKRRILVEQDLANNLKQNTYTLTGKMARKYYATTNSDPKTPNSCVTHCDETRHQHDELDHVTLVSVYRDGVVQNQIAYRHDAFNIVAEGPNDGTWPVQYQYDQASQKWFTDNSQGGVQLIGRNAAGDETVKVESMKIDLSTVFYSDFKAILQNRDTLENEFTEKALDLGGRMTALIEPGFSKNANRLPHAQKSILISHHFPQFGKISLSMEAHINPQRFYPELILTRIDDHQHESCVLPTRYCEVTKRFGVDITALSAGRYKVEIQHVRKTSQHESLPAFRWETEINWTGLLDSAAFAEEKSQIQLTHSEPLPENPQLHIWVEHFGQPGIWKKISSAQVNHVNNQLLFDRADLPRGKHLYHLGDPRVQNTFCILAPGEQAHLANPAVIPLGDSDVVRPVHQVTWAAFNKKASTTTPNGETTTFDHNPLSKLISVTEPAIPVMDESGNVTVAAAVTTIGRNELGNEIGVRDANNHTELKIRDEAEQVVIHTAADGTPYFQNTIDTHGDIVKVTSASGNTWKKTHNRKGKIIQVVLPSGDTWNYIRNEHDFIIKTVPPIGSAIGITLYGQGPFGDMNARYLPMGETHLNTHDHHHNELTHEAINIDGSLAYKTEYKRDYWGKVLEYTDAAGAKYKNGYYYNGSLRYKKGVNTFPERKMLPFDSTTNTFSTIPVQTPLQDLNYIYLNSLRLYSVEDKNLVQPQKQIKLFDLTRNPVYLKETNGSGNTLRETAMIFNTRHWAATQTDTCFSLDTYYDLISNRRRMNATYQSGTRNPIHHDGWWTHDTADRVLVNDGVMLNGKIKAVYMRGCGYYSRGNEFSYLHGLRHTQSLLVPTHFEKYADYNGLSPTLNYDCNERVSLITTTSALQPFLKPNALPLRLWWSGEFNLVWDPLNGPVGDGSGAIAIANGDDQPPRAFGDDQPPRASVPREEAGTVACTFTRDSIDCINYNVTYDVVATDVNYSDVYQGLIVMPIHGSDQNIHYPQQVCYLPDGPIDSIKMASLNNWTGICDITVDRFQLSKNQIVSDFYHRHLNGNDTDGFTKGTYSGFTVDGIAKNAVITIKSVGSNTATDNINNNTILFDAAVISAITVKRENENGSNVVTTNRYYSSNIFLNAVTNVFNPFNATDQSAVFNAYLDISLDGQPLKETCVQQNSSNVIDADFFQDTEGHIVTERSHVANSMGELDPIGEVLTVTANPVTPFNTANLFNIPTSVVIQFGESWKALAYRIFQDPNYASILHAYSGVTLTAGQCINVKQVIDAYNKALDFPPYQKFISLIFNALNPAIKTPQPPQPPPPKHHSFIDEIIGAIVAIVILIFAPEMIGAFLFGAGSLSALQLGIAFAIAGGLADAATQSVAIAFNDQHGFSLTEMVENSLASGLTAGFGKTLGIQTLLKDGKYLQAFALNTEIGVTVQLLEMAAGVRKQFDFKLIMEQAIAQSVTGKINNLLHNKSLPMIHGADELANATIDLAFGNTPNPVLLAANFLGDVAGDSADVLAKHITRHQPTASDDVTSSHQNEKSDESQNQYTNTHTNSNTNHQNQNQTDPIKMGDAREPTQSNELALQTESTWIDDVTATNNTPLSDPTDSFYSSFQNTVSNHLDNMNTASADAIKQSHRITQEQTQANLQQPRSIQHSTGFFHHDTLENKFSKILYDHQHDWWARGMLGIAAALNSNTMHMITHASAPEHAMDPIRDMKELSGYDPITGQAVSFKQANIDIGFSCLVFAFGGEFDSIATKVAVTGMRVTQASVGVGRNAIGMFGRGGANSIADKFDNAIGSNLNIGSNIAKHPLDGWTPEQVIQHVNQLGLKTPRDQLILWSGLGRNNAGISLSQQYAAENGGITLEMTIGGKWLNQMDLYGKNSPFSRAEAGKIWEKVSTSMIQEASGQVRSLIGEVNPSSIYRAEQAEIMMNNKILGLDELNLKPRYGFGNH